MERILDVSQQPPYVEVYSHAPLMCATLANTRQALAPLAPEDAVFWCHEVHSIMDDITFNLGLYKVKVLSNDGHTCLYSISPDMPPQQQADVMLHAAKQLRQALSKVTLPSGAQLAPKITIHAGKYAGAMVGKTAWSYDLFGEDVALLLDMDRCNEPNCIQVSQAALELLTSPQRQFVTGCKISHNERDIPLLRLTAEDANAGGAQAEGMRLGAAAGSPAAIAAAAANDVAEAAACLQQPSQAPLQQQQQQAHKQQPHKQQQQLDAAITSAQQAAKSACWQPSSSTSTGPSSSSSGSTAEVAVQPDLRFVQPAVEVAYLQSQGQALVRMDTLFIILSLLVAICSALEPSLLLAGHSRTTSFISSVGSMQQRLVASCSQWLLPAVAAVWLLAAPRAYAAWREWLWVAHRLAVPLHFTALLVLGGPQQQGLAVLPAAAGLQGLLGLHRDRALTLLADCLGFRVRFWLHALTSAASLGLSLGFWFSHNSSSSGSLQLPVMELLGRAAPLVLLYLWEAEQRWRFAQGLLPPPSNFVGKEASGAACTAGKPAAVAAEEGVWGGSSWGAAGVKCKAL